MTDLVTQLAACAQRRGDDIVIAVRVSPRAKHNEVAGVRNGFLQIRTTAPPADGKANKAVTRLLARHLGIAPSRISLLRGQAHRHKQFLVKDAANGL